MTLRTRKLFGTIGLIVVLAVYAALVMVFYDTFLRGQPAPLLIGFFAVAGLAWVLPAGAILTWISRASGR